MSKFNKKLNLSELINRAKSEVLSSVQDASSLYGNIPDIITFVESEDYLNIKTLYPAQKLILKFFYRGSTGNEHLELTQEDIDVCNSLGLNCDDNGNFLEKWNNKTNFRELVLVWGRRSGKDYISSIVALYETLKLLELGDGDPHSYYGLEKGSLISVLTVASSSEQAETAFAQVKNKFMNSKYFLDKSSPEGVQMYSIFLRTKYDKKENDLRRQKGMEPILGSICIKVGHSNSDTLRGKDIYTCIFDEVAFYKDTAGASGGQAIYDALSPAVGTFVRVEKHKDSEGNEVVVRKYEGKMLFISSPDDRSGLFFNMYRNSPKVKHRLMCRLSTWQANPNHTEQSLREFVPDFSEERFQKEYGAFFSGSSSTTFFTRDQVESCFDGRLRIKGGGEPGHVYFAHLDPASTQHNYALVVVHKEGVILPNGTKDWCIVVDHIKHWSPSKGNPIKNSEVDEYLLNLRKRFHFAVVSYDHWVNRSGIEKIIKAGMPAKITPFTGRYHMLVYGELYDLVISNRLKIPNHDLLKKEMISLQKKISADGSKYRVMPKADGDCQTDDIIDALAGACYNCMSVSSYSLPLTRVVYTGNPSSNERLWQSMSGPIGYGTGQQVANSLEKINSWPASKRR